jgi:hypothetical protein
MFLYVLQHVFAFFFVGVATFLQIFCPVWVVYFSENCAYSPAGDSFVFFFGHETTISNIKQVPGTFNPGLKVQVSV